MAEKPMQEPEADEKPDQPSREVGRIEWIVGAAGALITIAVLATLIHEALTYKEGAPVLVSRVIGVTPTEGGFVVRFETENRGPSTAAEVVVSATLKDGERVVEQAEATLDYIARQSSRDAGIVLRRDPASGTLELAATSYRAP
ncbi:TIGR02588 family protein [Hansschlegelia plantiphila]|uniref:TIGR02588 family protein n=1 Tax=Hansschlegelia plantiphila TaxID=374655 RepID=A0A9W6J2K1_9HYPH|nr:TIGR02588 family protein [Hansschlegelia plantiphila]GLK68120.1 hypothetical protein GCM10008179_17580 [Hansschlegelia plantiphila]